MDFCIKLSNGETKSFDCPQPTEFFELSIPYDVDPIWDGGCHGTDWGETVGIFTRFQHFSNGMWSVNAGDASYILDADGKIWFDQAKTGNLTTDSNGNDIKMKLTPIEKIPGEKTLKCMTPNKATPCVDHCFFISGEYTFNENFRACIADTLYDTSLNRFSPEQQFTVQRFLDGLKKFDNPD